MSISFKDFILELEREFRSKSLPALSVSDFLLSEPMTTTELRSVLTKTNRKWIKQYKGKFDESGLQVADLQQNPSVRPRWGGQGLSDFDNRLYKDVQCQEGPAVQSRP